MSSSWHAPSEAGFLRVDDLLVDRVRRRVTRDAVEIPLSRRSFDFLLALVRVAPEVATFEQLMVDVWPGVVVGSETVSQRVKILREALGDSASRPRYVAGVRGRGYRVVAPVSVAADPAADHPPGHAAEARTVLPAFKVWVAAAALLAALLLVPFFAAPLAGWGDRAGAAPESAAATLAVLPFADLSEEQDQAYFSEGLAEELVTLLGRTSTLRVIARRSALALMASDEEAVVAAARLGVTHVLSGSVRRAGDHVRISLQLVNAGTRSTVWSQSYDGELGDVLRVQEEIASSVATALAAELLAEPHPGRTPLDTSAYDDFLKAQYFYDRRAQGDLSRARDYYQRALASDPRFARAWTGLAGLYLLEVASGKIPRDEGLARAQEAAQHALSLQPGLPDAHVRLGQSFHAAGDLHAAARHFRAALDAGHDSPLVLSTAADEAAARGNLARAIELQQRAVAIDPATFVHRANLAVFLAADGRLEEALVEYTIALELNPAPEEDGVLGGATELGLARVLILLGRPEEALGILEPASASAARDQCLALVADALGRPDEFAVAFERLSASSPAAPLRVAELHAHRGEADRAFDWLDRARAQIELADRDDPKAVPGALWTHLLALQASAFLRPLRGDGRWVRHISELERSIGENGAAANSGVGSGL
jgi:TolB-like protein/DNA-binding winged helix-turn-helix (wHTH) protein/Flp pilus assembly protein TadD